MAELFEKLWAAAVEREDELEVTRLVKQIGVNYRDSRRRTVLHYAARYNRKSMIEHLVGLGADINARDRSEWTPLHHALSRDTTEFMMQTTMKENFPLLSDHCRTRLLERNETISLVITGIVEKEKIELVNCLLDLGANVNARCNLNMASIHVAIRVKSVPGVKVLAKLGLYREQTLGNKERLITGRTALFLAMEQGQKELMKNLVYRGADVNAGYITGPPLHAAIESRNTDIVETLLKNWADKSGRTIYNMTPVNHAVTAKFRDFGIFTCLAQLGANFNKPVTMSHAIHEAVVLEQPDILNCLVRNGVDVKYKWVTNRPPILTAIFDYEIKILEHLVQCGADVNATYNDRIGTMIMAARKGNIDMVKALVEHGFAIHEEIIIMGLTALTDFLRNGYSFIQRPGHDFEKLLSALAWLVTVGANVNATYQRFSVIHDTVLRGNVEMVVALVNSGATLNSPANRKVTILSEFILHKLLKSKQFDEAIVNILVAFGANVNAESELVKPLLLAVERSDTVMVETLCRLGADKSSVMIKGLGEPVKCACQLDTADILECLIQHGANQNAPESVGIEALLVALLLGDSKMVQCLLNCEANPRIGANYVQLTAISTAIHTNNSEALSSLLQAGFTLPTHILYGDIQHLFNEEARQIANRCGVIIPTEPLLSYTLLTDSMSLNVNSDIFQMLLMHGANRKCGYNVTRKPLYLTPTIMEHTFSNLHAACQRGDLDIARLLIIDGSDVNDQDSFGKVPFELLPLASSVDYHTLQETRTAKKVITEVGEDFTPILPYQSMEALVITPGLGNVRNIAHPKSTEIDDQVHWAMMYLGKKLNLFSKIVNCGSAGEGTKVGLPDEMDFLIEIDTLTSTEQLKIKDAGHDYVYYSDNRQHKLKEGSKDFHLHFLSKFHFPPHTTFTFERSSLTLRQPASELIRDSNRKATSPIEMNWQAHIQETSHVTISVDAVPSLHVKDRWLKRGIHQTWLLSNEELKHHGYYLVPKPPHASGQLAKQYTLEQLQSLWKISFPHLETLHMQHIESRVKNVYVLVKCLRNPDVCRILITDKGSWPKNVSKYITSYMLKMIFFKNVEYFLGANLSLGEMACQVFDEVEEGLSEGFIPLYFMPEVSALAGHKLDLPKCAKVARFMKKFVHALYLRDCKDDLYTAGDVDEVIIYRREQASVYRYIDITQPGEMPEMKLWDGEQSPRLQHSLLKIMQDQVALVVGVFEY